MAPGGTYEQRRRAGEALRRAVPRSSHRTWRPPANRADPVTAQEENNVAQSGRVAAILDA